MTANNNLEEPGAMEQQDTEGAGCPEGAMGLRRIPVTLCTTDQVVKAEILWALKVVDSGFSFSSCDNIVPILRLMDPDSKVFAHMSMKRVKMSYYLTHGLLPYYQRKLIKRIQDSPAYTLGTDAGTFKLHGLAKVVDIMIR